MPLFRLKDVMATTYSGVQCLPVTFHLDGTGFQLELICNKAGVVSAEEMGK